MNKNGGEKTSLLINQKEKLNILCRCFVWRQLFFLLGLKDYFCALISRKIK